MIGQPNCAEWLPLGHLNLPYLALVPNKHLIKLNKYNTLLSLLSVTSKEETKGYAQYGMF